MLGCPFVLWVWGAGTSARASALLQRGDGVARLSCVLLALKNFACRPGFARLAARATVPGAEHTGIDHDPAGLGRWPVRFAVRPAPHVGSLRAVLRWSREKAAQTTAISSLPVEPRCRRDTRPPERNYRHAHLPRVSERRGRPVVEDPTATTRRTTSLRRRRPVAHCDVGAGPPKAATPKAATPKPRTPKSATPKAATPARSSIDDEDDDGYDDDFNESPQKPKKTADRPLKIGSPRLSVAGKLMRVADEDELMARADKTLEGPRSIP